MMKCFWLLRWKHGFVAKLLIVGVVNCHILCEAWPICPNLTTTRLAHSLKHLAPILLAKIVAQPTQFFVHHNLELLMQFQCCLLPLFLDALVLNHIFVSSNDFVNSCLIIHYSLIKVWLPSPWPKIYPFHGLITFLLLTCLFYAYCLIWSIMVWLSFYHLEFSLIKVWLSSPWFDYPLIINLFLV